ncbi:M23 family metallopeptidase [Streptomyces sp. NPDC053493]|uniref:M23 family metallopeptidase n=1 Tax=Streptomyces sp. NPDC053493 TaxID=3365705 RepID=UPI0037CD4191
MNDQHPHAGYVTDATQTTGSFAVDPLFGTYDAGYDAGQSGYTGYTEYAEYAPHSDQQQHGYSGYSDYSGGQWDSGSYGSYTATGQWDATAWTEAQQTGTYETAAFASQDAHASYDTYDATGQWTTPGFETGSYDATAWNQTAGATPEPVVPQQYIPEQYSPEQYASDEQYAPEEHYAPEHTAEFAFDEAQDLHGTQDAHDTHGYAAETYEDAFHNAETMVALEIDPDLAGPSPVPSDAELPARPVRRSGGGGSRGRRRTPAKRSALLTVAVPSACVMGVAGIAAASVGGLTDGGSDAKDDTTSLAAADPASVKQVAANSELDTQLAALSADARDFGDRASRTQERIDLKLRQEAEKKKREEEAARKEALRPKFLLPVKLHQLSARYGQAGVNWMSLHTGIDFPVQYGTPVMAATDGTVRTQWNSAYGNMAIVTSPDGTETWYCHLSSTKIRSGKVKAGDVIAYSGNSGNSTGPHLHFEVRPNGGAAIDPLPWLLRHGLDPTS